MNSNRLKRSDLLLLDVFLSGGDGRDVCAKLRAEPESATLPIIMISAHPNMRDAALAAGADDFISKPFVVPDLLKKIEGLLLAVV